MSEQNPEQQPSGQPAQNPTPTPPPAAEKQPPWGDKPENFDPDTAWALIQRLKAERGDPNALKAVKDSTDQRLLSELNTLKSAQQQQQDAIAKAFGIKPEEVSDTDRLAREVGTLKEQIHASQRRALAAEHKVPESLLTATDAEGMKAQAEALVEFAKGAHAAAAPPAFTPNPGQGQGNAPLSPEAQAAAEYEAFYPAAPQRR